MVQEEMRTGDSLENAEERVLAAVLSADGDPNSAASRHCRGSKTHWRFLANTPHQFVGYSNIGARSADKQKKSCQAEVGKLTELIFREFRIPLVTQNRRRFQAFEDLEYLLTTNYDEVVRRFLSKEILEKLSTVGANVLRSALLSLHSRIGAGERRLETSDMLEPLYRMFGPENFEIRAEPYRQGAGLSLRGFFCRSESKGKRSFLIFLNTAHSPGVVTATFAHELGHLIYMLLGHRGNPIAAFDSSFRHHLEEEDEVFADALVALSMYSLDLIRIIGPIDALADGEFSKFVCLLLRAYALMPSPYRIDLFDPQLSKSRRLYHLTELVHFLRLRCALYTCMQI